MVDQFEEVRDQIQGDFFLLTTVLLVKVKHIKQNISLQGVSLRTFLFCFPKTRKGTIENLKITMVGLSTAK